LESYLDTCFCAFLNSVAFYTFYQEGKIDLFYDTGPNIWNTSSAAVFFVIAFIYPLWLFLVIKKNFDKLDTKEVSNKYGVFYEGINTQEYHSAQYNTYFMLRRLFTIATIIFMYNYYFYQVQLLIVISTLNMMYLVG